MAPKGSRKGSLCHGVLAVDKPSGMTSQDCVNVVRRVASTRQVGHTGTLDPLATGLLVLLVGEATKLSEYIIGFDKTYEGVARLGVESNTYDSEGDIKPGPSATLPSLDQLNALAQRWVGEIDQVPPPYSAVKIDGRKLYEYARAGETIEAEARAVRVDAFELSDLVGQTAADCTVRFKVACTSGTYVRSLIHDLGQAAGCGALVAELRRTRVGDFDIAEASTLDALKQMSPEQFAEALLPIVDGLSDWPAFFVLPEGQGWLKRGQAIPISLAEPDPQTRPARIGDLVFLQPPGRDAMAIARVVAAPPSKPPASLQRHVGAWLQPVKLFNVEAE